MTYKESILDPVGGERYDLWRFQIKKMAALLTCDHDRRPDYRFTLFRTARKVTEGTVTVWELAKWLPMALEATEKRRIIKA